MKKLFYILFLLGLASCAKDDQEELPKNFEGYSYLPLELAQERVYRVDSIAYDDFTGTIDTNIYYVRERIQSMEVDLGGKTVYKVAVFERTSDTLAWRQVRIEEKHRGVYRYEHSRNSLVYIPLVFPPLEESRWNVNALNNQLEQNYRYKNLHQKFTTPTKSYDSTITVLQKDFLSLIGREYEREVYASGLGLIYKESTNIETDINSGQITSGFEVKRFLID